MNDHDDKKKVGSIQRTTKTEHVEKVEEVGRVGRVEKTGGVGKAGKVGLGGINSSELRYADREKLMGMVDEEAEKLLGKSKLPEEQKRIIREAVKMAVDASLVPDKEEDAKEDR